MGRINIFLFCIINLKKKSSFKRQLIGTLWCGSFKFWYIFFYASEMFLSKPQRKWQVGSFTDQCEKLQDHTSQDHFCSVINDFPVWKSKPYSTTMMRQSLLLWAWKRLSGFCPGSCLLDIDDRLSLHKWGAKELETVWVASKATFPSVGGKSTFYWFLKGLFTCFKWYERALLASTELVMQGIVISKYEYDCY